MIPPSGLISKAPNDRPHWSIRFDGFDNPLQEEQLRRDMAPALRFLPAWVLYIYVKRDDSGDDEGATISCDPNLAYRRFTLTVYDAYFSYDDSYRRQCCMHEAIHGITAGVIRWVDDRLLTPIASINTEIYGLLRKEWIERLESMTEELTAIFERELHGKEPDPWPQPAPVKYQPASDTP